jgi:hypothetical protein
VYNDLGGPVYVQLRQCMKVLVHSVHSVLPTHTRLAIPPGGTPTRVTIGSNKGMFLGSCLKRPFVDVPLTNLRHNVQVQAMGA